MFLTPIWDPQAHKAPKMTFPQGGPEWTFYVLADTLRMPKFQKYQNTYFFPGRPTSCDSVLPLVKIPVFHFFEKVNKGQLKMVNVNY